MTNAIRGTYTTKRDGGRVYTYEASWSLSGRNVVWNAKASRDGRLAGTPNGQIFDARGVDLSAEVKALVENSIEIRAGVD